MKGGEVNENAEFWLGVVDVMDVDLVVGLVVSISASKR
jgi:hypothetical protein